MAAHCLGMLTITDTISEHIDVEDEVRLYGTCSSIYDGNKAHRDFIKKLRDYYYYYSRHYREQQSQARRVLPSLQRFAHTSSQGSNKEKEAAQRAPPLYRVWLEVRLEDLCDRRPETMPIPDSCSPEPIWDAD